MSESWSRRVLAALGVLTLLFFGGWILRETRARRAHAVRLPVEGYDPRDLLSGHYVRFRLSAEREATALTHSLRAGSEVDVCLEEREGGLLRVGHLLSVDGHATGADCRRFLRGRVARGGVSFGVDRFYVDERRASAVAQVRAGPRTYLLATLDARGGVHPLDLVVDGVSVRGDDAR